MYILIWSYMYILYLVAGLNPSEKYESIGMIRNPIDGKIKNGNQTTNQIYDHIYIYILYKQNQTQYVTAMEPDVMTSYDIPLCPKFCPKLNRMVPKAIVSMICVCICRVCMYIYIYIHIWMHIWYMSIHIYVYTHMDAHMIYVYTYIYIHMYIYIYVAYIYIHTCILYNHIYIYSVYIYIHINMNLNMYVYTYLPYTYSKQVQLPFIISVCIWYRHIRHIIWMTCCCNLSDQTIHMFNSPVLLMLLVFQNHSINMATLTWFSPHRILGLPIIFKQSPTRCRHISSQQKENRFCYTFALQGGAPGAPPCNPGEVSHQKPYSYLFPMAR